MYILGVNISHEPSMCLLKDGEIVYYCETERLVGEKYHDINHEDVSFETQVEVLSQYTTYIDFVIFTSFGTDPEDVDNMLIRRTITELGEGGVDFNTSLFYKQNHHLYHAANAFYASGWDSAAALIMDGGGAYDPDYRESYTSNLYDDYPFREVETIYNCNYDNPLWEKSWCHYSLLDPIEEKDIFWKKSPNEIYSNSLSCGDLFNRMVSYLEMNSGDAGKVMGLSGHRLATDSFVERMKVARQYEGAKPEFIIDWFMEKEGEMVTVPGIEDAIYSFIEKENLDTSLRVPGHDFYVLASLTHKLQEETFKHTCKLIQKTIDITGQNKIVLSGGYFLNCVNNYKYLKEFPNVEFFVDPIPHDSGTAIGAAKYAWYGISKSKEKHPFKDIYFGPSV